MTARRRVVSPLLWCLVFLGLPQVGLAAGDAPWAELPRLALSGPLAGPEVAPDPAVSPPSESYRPSRGLRVLTEVGAGAVTALVGGVGLALAGNGLCAVTGLGDSDFGCIGPIFLGTVLGFVEGYGLGVWWGGEVMKGDGSLGLTLLGASVGGLVGYALVYSDQPRLGAYTLVVLPVLLAHLGYELFQREPPLVQPLVSFSSGGSALLGLGGRF